MSSRAPAYRRTCLPVICLLAVGLTLSGVSPTDSQTTASAAQAAVPVILVHGINGNVEHWTGHGWATIEDAELRDVDEVLDGASWRVYQAESDVFDVRGREVPVYVFDYNRHQDGHGDIPLAAGMLSDAIAAVKQRTGSSHVFLVGYSLGGIISRTYMQSQGKKEDSGFWGGTYDAGYRGDVVGLATLDSPHRGSSILDTFWRGGIAERVERRDAHGDSWWKLFRTSDPAEDQLEASSDFMTQLADGLGELPAEATYGYFVGSYYDFLGDGLLKDEEQRPASVPGATPPARTRWANVVHAGPMEDDGWDEYVEYFHHSSHVDVPRVEVLDAREAKDFAAAAYLRALASYEVQPVGQDSATSLVVDVSTSMDGGFRGRTKIDEAKGAALAIVEIIRGYYENQRAQALIGVGAFSSEAYSTQPLTEDWSALTRAIDSLSTIGDTNLVAAIGVGVEQLQAAGAGCDKALFLLSDGEDSVGNTAESILEEADFAAANGIRIYTIGFGEPGDLDEGLLQNIASLTGGEYSLADPGTAFSLVEQLARSQVSRSGASVLLSSTGTVGAGSTAGAGSASVPDVYGDLQAILTWPGSTLDLNVVDPDGVMVSDDYPGYSVTNTERTSQVLVKGAMPGEWEVSVYGADVSSPEEPFYALVAFKETTETVPAGGGGSPSGGGGEATLLLIALAAGGVVVWLVLRSRMRSTAEVADEDAPTYRFSLVSKSGELFILRMGANTLGRSSDSDVALSSRSVSRQHALIVVSRDGVSVRDLGSTAGVMVDGKCIRKEARIAPGTQVTVGDVVLTLKESGASRNDPDAVRGEIQR